MRPHHCPTWEDPGGCRCDDLPERPVTGPGAGRGADEQMVEKAAQALNREWQWREGFIWTLDEVEPIVRAVLAAVWDDLPAAQPTVAAIDRAALADTLADVVPGRPEIAYEKAVDLLIAAAVVEDAAQVRADERRKVAEEIAAAIEAERFGNAPADYVAGLNDGAYIAREAASSEEVSDDG